MVTARTSGIWTDVKSKGNPSVGKLTGVGTNFISWGVIANRANKQSAYRFEGVPAVEVPLDGTEFLLGTFTHFNFTITNQYSIREVTLPLTLEIEGGIRKTYNFRFKHTETPNIGGAVNDIVEISAIPPKEIITIGGKQYELSVTGFLQNGKRVTRFSTQEARENSAQLFGKLVEIPVIEPPVIKPPVIKPPVQPPTCCVLPVQPILIPYPCPYPIGYPYPGPGIGYPGIGYPGPGIGYPGTGYPGPGIGYPGTGYPTTQPTAPTTVTIAISGVWSSIIEEVAGATAVQGLGTNLVSWGLTYPGGFQSAYHFAGVGSISCRLDGSSFAIGTFTHYNYPIYRYTIRSATLKVTLGINGQNIEVEINFGHYETPNTGGNDNAPDYVYIINGQSTKTITIGSISYVLNVLGFFQNGQVVKQLATVENQTSSAELYCQLVATNQPGIQPVAPTWQWR